MSHSASAKPTDRIWIFVSVASVALKLWLVAAQPIVAVGPAGHDDRLFLELANHLLNGDWLGPYSQFTLMKGPMYSLFAAASFLCGFPLPLAQHLLYLGACWLLVRALKSYLTGPSACALFTLLWWNPMTYDLPVLGRVLRQNVYTPLTLLFFAAAIALALRLSARPAKRIVWSALLGVSVAGLWLTREETIWLVPSATLLAGAAAVTAWRGRRVRALVVSLGVAVATGGGFVATVAALNYAHYGWFGTVEFRAPEFLAAYGSLQRVTSSYHVRYVPVTREAREKAYAISPAFAELRPYLEGSIGKNWSAASSAATGRPEAEREMAGGWFMWALRDAVVAAGHGTSARAALGYYAKVAAEVNQACDDGRLPAGRRRDSMVPKWQPGNFTRLQKSLPEFVSAFVTFQGFSAYPTASTGDAETLKLFRDLTRWKLAPSPDAPELDRPQQQRLDVFRLGVLQAIGQAMRWIGAGLFLFGLAFWIAGLIRMIRSRQCGYLFPVASAALIGAAAVLAINLMVHVMSFPNFGPGAFAQGYPLLLLFGALSLFTKRNA